ncbi:MAG: RidA family protein [Burkholderiaceae bacterium]
MTTFIDPPTVHATGGLYSHSVIVPAGTDLVFLSGQVGVRPDGAVAEGLAAQAEQVFANIGALLAAHGLDAASLVKLNTYVVAGQDVTAVRAARVKYLNGHRATSTLVFVPQLADKAWLVEVEAVAARRTA